LVKRSVVSRVHTYAETRDMPNLIDPKYVTLRAGSARAGISVASLRRMVKDGRLKAYRPLGAKGRIVLSTTELDRLIRGSATASGTGK
jgi:hypothetical protein